MECRLFSRHVGLYERLRDTEWAVCVLDESMIGGLSLLLMAGQHAADSVTSPMLSSGNSMRPDHFLLTAAAVSGHDMRQPPPREVNAAMIILCCSSSYFPFRALIIDSCKFDVLFFLIFFLFKWPSFVELLPLGHTTFGYNCSGFFYRADAFPVASGGHSYSWHR